MEQCTQKYREENESSTRPGTTRDKIGTQIYNQNTHTHTHKRQKMYRAHLVGATAAREPPAAATAAPAVGKAFATGISIRELSAALAAGGVLLGRGVLGAARVRVGVLGLTAAAGVAALAARSGGLERAGCRGRRLCRNLNTKCEMNGLVEK
jgi:hypothetical protein